MAMQMMNGMHKPALRLSYSRQNMMTSLMHCYGYISIDSTHVAWSKRDALVVTQLSCPATDQAPRDLLNVCSGPSWCC